MKTTTFNISIHKRLKNVHFYFNIIYCSVNFQSILKYSRVNVRKKQSNKYCFTTTLLIQICIVKTKSPLSSQVWMSHSVSQYYTIEYNVQSSHPLFTLQNVICIECIESENNSYKMMLLLLLLLLLLQLYYFIVAFFSPQFVWVIRLLEMSQQRQNKFKKEKQLNYYHHP